VFGWSTTVVTPPAAAPREPEVHVSLVARARLAEVDVDVDGAGEKVASPRVDDARSPVSASSPAFVGSTASMVPSRIRTSRTRPSASSAPVMSMGTRSRCAA